MPWDDARIIESVLAGEVDRFELLIHRHERTVLAIIKKHIPSEQVEDMAQEVFVRAYQSLKNYKGSGDFKSWLAAIAVRACYDYWRKHYRRKEVSWEGASEKQRLLISHNMAQEAMARYDQKENLKEDQELLQWALDQLPAAERMVLELVYFEDLPGKEVARLLGWSVANVKIRTYRARNKLRRILQKNFQEYNATQDKN
jgi:RNA polymerase sigma-70 factor, ECF subfamily